MTKNYWKIFEAKFSDNPQWHFERMCYLLFCEEFKRPFGINRYKNQTGIETEPLKHGEYVIGMQAKFYDSKLSAHKKDLLDMLELIKRRYPDLNKLYFYSNAQWSQGKINGKSQPEIEVEAKAEESGIEIEWRLSSFFESPFVSNNKVIFSEFFTPTYFENVESTVERLNREYKREFIPLKTGFISRAEEKECINYIEQGENFIIHGKAGRGKSGITANLINHLESMEIPYLAIKLDKRIPKNNSDEWSKALGLSCNVAECIDFISANNKGVLILDQLDALRWTNFHSRTALEVCEETIDRINVLNTKRDNEISIIFVCRTYDLNNDAKIKKLFDNTVIQAKWSKILISDLTESDACKIIGPDFERLNAKTKQVLRVLSNIFILQEINRTTSVNEINQCSSTAKLIERWWEEIKKNGVLSGFKECDLEESKNQIVDAFEKFGGLSLIKRRLKVSTSIIDFLVSQNFLVFDGEKVSFAHQSVLDYLFAQKMEENFSNGVSVEEVIGNVQTPIRRFQLQLLLQMILEYDPVEFIDFGQSLIKSSIIRNSFKFVFYEMLSQVDEAHYYINEFIINHCETDIKISESIATNKISIRLLMDKGILDKWILQDDKINHILSMITTLSENYTEKDLDFLEKHIDLILKTTRGFYIVFGRDVIQDSDRLFELRMIAYKKYPNLITEVEINLVQAFNKNNERIIRLIKLALESEGNSDSYSSKREHIYLDNDDQINIINPEFILNELLPNIPIGGEFLFEYSNWSCLRTFSNTFERLVIRIIELASKELIQKQPEVFFNIFQSYMGKGYYLHNEIILFALRYADEKYSSKIIQYLCNDLDNNIFDFTGDTNNKLAYTKDVINRHSKYCTDDEFKELESKIYQYKPNDMYQTAKDKYENRKSNDWSSNWHFHGDLQHELLKELDVMRISEKTKNYIRVLNRKFKSETKYKKIKACIIRNIVSPIRAKKLNNKQWLQILTNKNINENPRRYWSEQQDKYIDNSLSQFSSDFQNAVSAEPDRFILLYLANHNIIRTEFVPSLLQGISSCENINDISINSLEELILLCCKTYDERIYGTIFGILGKLAKHLWSDSIINLIFETAQKDTKSFHEWEYSSNNEDKIHYILTRSINNVKCKAIRALANILLYQKEMLACMKSIILQNIDDEDIAIRYAVFELLRVMYYIDRNFAIPYIIEMLKSNTLVAGAPYADELIFWLSKNNDLTALILKMYNSDHKSLSEKGCKLIFELYLRDGLFENIIKSLDDIDIDKKRIFLHTAVKRFDNPEHNVTCKRVINLCKCKEFDNAIARLFRNKQINWYRDKDFLLQIKDVGQTTLHTFYKYLTENNISILEYHDIIIRFCEAYISGNDEISYYQDSLPNLLLRLYDESNRNGEYREISIKCLDLLDIMFEKNIGNTRRLSKELMDR